MTGMGAPSQADSPLLHLAALLPLGDRGRKNAGGGGRLPGTPRAWQCRPTRPCSPLQPPLSTHRLAGPRSTSCAGGHGPPRHCVVPSANLRPQAHVIRGRRSPEDSQITFWGAVTVPVPTWGLRDWGSPAQSDVLGLMPTTSGACLASPTGGSFSVSQ